MGQASHPIVGFRAAFSSNVSSLCRLFTRHRRRHLPREGAGQAAAPDEVLAYMKRHTAEATRDSPARQTMPSAACRTAGFVAAGPLSGFTYKEMYDLYNQQLHYARAYYSSSQLDLWQTEWNRYFTQHRMEIPVYAHKV